MITATDEGSGRGSRALWVAPRGLIVDAGQDVESPRHGVFHVTDVAGLPVIVCGRSLWITAR